MDKTLKIPEVSDLCLEKLRKKNNSYNVMSLFDVMLKRAPSGTALLHCCVILHKSFKNLLPALASSIVSGTRRLQPGYGWMREGGCAGPWESQGCTGLWIRGCGAWGKVGTAALPKFGRGGGIRRSVRPPRALSPPVGSVGEGRDLEELPLRLWAVVPSQKVAPAVCMVVHFERVINAGKSTHNEDQASCEVLTVKKKAGAITSTPNRNSKRRSSLPNGEGLQLKENSESEGVSCHYWSLFDGHAGSGAAVVASRLLQQHVTEQLQDIVEILKNSAVLPPTCLGEEPESSAANSRTLTRAASLRGGVGAPGSPSTPPTRFFTEKKIPHECLVIGALESAFKEMDLQIERERSSYNISGGCTALIVVCLLGKLYVANAGDSRAIIIRNGEIIPMSSEFTPETERQRLQYLAFMQPHLLGNEFTHLEFPRRVQRKELGKKMLYRDFNMTGWAYKTIEDDDLKFPLIYGEGKKARVMATIGVTRGLGDHDLKVHDSNIYIKPFLSSAPEGRNSLSLDDDKTIPKRNGHTSVPSHTSVFSGRVYVLPLTTITVNCSQVRVYDLSKYEHGADDVLILATDGLWDVLSNEEVAEAITQFLPNCDPDDPHRYTLAAQDLVMRARGVLKDRGWRISNDRLGSGDDISVYVIPLIHGNKLS
ncbi:Protein phosphatase 1H [Tupaia chinensis]|uniref:Protein phosphatase 1H n=1 Tax=Tupaia chinensis TaxID=246437 RepID=L9KGC8_TUPCH|nr:Protein phosphatase 1H [Tupaia chinensis]